jgi:hypothetical protein
MFAALLFTAFAQAPVALPPEVNCCRILVDIEFLLDLDASSRATISTSLDSKAPEYSAALAKRLAEAKQNAGKLQETSRKLLEAQKRALKEDFVKISERAFREHFLDKINAVMLHGDSYQQALKPLYDELTRNIDPEAKASK